MCKDINNILDTKDNLSWGDIGPLTAEALYKSHNHIILLNNYEIVKDGCNFICWLDTPGINKKKWYFQKEEDAKNKSTKLKAELVITTRLHCILPCRAFNTNAIFIHQKYNNDSRFTGLKNIINGDFKVHNNLQGNRDDIGKIRQEFLSLKI